MSKKTPDLKLVDGNYREPSPPSPPTPTNAPTRWFVVSGESSRRHEVFPHDYGRWSCPGCGAWRWLAMFTRNPEHAVGRALPVELSVTKAQSRLEGSCDNGDWQWYRGPTLLWRSCPRCHLAWRVAPRTAELAR